MNLKLWIYTSDDVLKEKVGVMMVFRCQAFLKKKEFNFNKMMKILMLSSFSMMPISSLFAQDIQTAMSVDELKKEMIHRSEINLYPVYNIPPEIMKGIANEVKTLNIDEWTKAYIKVGDSYFSKGMSYENSDKEKAIYNFGMAQRLYNMGRWPAILTKSREQSYKLEIKAFEAVQRLKGINLERVESKYKNYNSVAYLVKPKQYNDKLPIVISIGGLDGWKEARITQLSPLLDKGAAILSIDMPGTGQTEVKMGTDAEAVLFTLIEKVLQRNDIDQNRVVFYGGSFGGYWTTLLAARNKIKLAGVVDQSGPYSETFKPNKLGTVFEGKEYLYDSLPSLSNLIHGINGREQLLNAMQEQAIDRLVPLPLKIDSPILVIGGKHDSLVPQEDLLPLLFSEGDVREAWINPNGIHMGRERGKNIKWDDKTISKEIIFPWILARLGLK